MVVTLIIFSKRELETNRFQKKVDNSGQQNTGFQGVAGQNVSRGIAPDAQPPVSYQAQFAPSAQPTLQYPAPVNYAPTPPVTPPEPPEEEPDAKPRFSLRSIRLTPMARTILITSALFAVLAAAAVGGYLYWQSRQSAQQATSDASVSSALSFDVQQLPLNELGAGALQTIQGTRKLSINGQLEVNNSLVVMPTAQPREKVWLFRCRDHTPGLPLPLSRCCL